MSALTLFITRSTRIILGSLLSWALPINASTLPALHLTIHGSNTLGAKLIPHCAKAYLESKNIPSVRIDITGENKFRIQGESPNALIWVAAHGSSTGYRSLDAGVADIGMSSRPIKEKEVSLLERFGYMRSTASEHTVAIDGLAILVNKTNNIGSLTTTQIAQIFSGEINNWQQLGGVNAAISLHARDNNSGTWDTFKSLILKKTYQLDDSAKRYESNDELSDTVARDPYAIGFSGIASIRNAKALAVSDEGTQAIAPSHLSVATEDYPLTRRLYLYTPERNVTDDIREFVSFCQSEKGQEVVAQVGYISQNIQAVKQEDFVNAPQAYRELMYNGDRLSVNFRFNRGSSRLDNKALMDVSRLQNFMAKPENQHKKLVLVGFNDEVKSQTGKRSDVLSKLRATAVRSALFKSGIPVNKTLGLGTVMPLAAVGQKISNTKNGRVEVWLLPDSVAGEPVEKSASMAYQE
ncbi:MAG: substrate-binding domain-containing protein [Cellvibrionaceae bacterium]